MNFATIVARRGAIRRFRSEPVPRELLHAALALAQRAPSNCNTQPWLVRIVSGAARDRLSATLMAAGEAQRFTIDFPFQPQTFTEPYKSRHFQHGHTLHLAHGVSRDDAEGRRAMLANNLSFFGAPHVAFFFMPAWGNERQASDVGMFAQTLALALAAEGIGTCPQAVLSFFADAVRGELNVGSDYRLLYGMSIGYPDADVPEHRVEQPRADFDESIRFMED